MKYQETNFHLSYKRDIHKYIAKGSEKIQENSIKTIGNSIIKDIMRISSAFGFVLNHIRTMNE